MKHPPKIDRALRRFYSLRADLDKQIIATVDCPFCHAKKGKRCQKNPPHGKSAPFSHVDRRFEYAIHCTKNRHKGGQ